MGFFDLSVYITIAICYNLFVHQLTSMIYKDLPFEDKYNKSLTFMFIAGIVGIIISKMMLRRDDYNKKRKTVVSTGLMLGGLLLIITSIFVNWENITDELRLCISGVIFGALLWYFYNHYDDSDVRDKKIQKKKMEILNWKMKI